MDSREISTPELIVVDEDEQPPEKRARDDGVPSLSLSLPHPCLEELASLRQKLAKSATMYKRACLAARQAELRAERAENLLDSQRATADGSTEVPDGKPDKSEMARLNASLAEDLEVYRRREEIAKSKNSELAITNSALERQLDSAVKREELANGLRDDMARVLAALREELRETKWQEVKDRMRDRERIDELTRKLAQLEQLQSAQQPPDVQPEPAERSEESSDAQPEPVDSTLPLDLSQLASEQTVDNEARESTRRLSHDLHKNPDPINIFQLCLPTKSSATIAIGFAAIKIRAQFDECDGAKYDEYCRSWALKHNRLECAVCGLTLRKCKVVEHFLSQEHYWKVRSVGAVVSRPAVQFWLQHLESAAAAAKTESAAPQPVLDVIDLD